MATLPVVKPKQVLKALQRAGYFIVRQTGSHIRLIHRTEVHRRVSVPLHNYKREFYNICTREYAESWIGQITEFRGWIEQML